MFLRRTRNFQRERITLKKKSSGGGCLSGNGFLWSQLHPPKVTAQDVTPGKIKFTAKTKVLNFVQFQKMFEIFANKTSSV